MNLMATNPLNEVRDVRRKISDDCGNDPERVFDYYLQHQEAMKSTGKFQFTNTPIDTVHAAHASDQSDKAQ
jgi:hypothetical protein